MPDYTLAPVDYQPDFENYSLIPVDYDPYAHDGSVHYRVRVQQGFTLVRRETGEEAW